MLVVCAKEVTPEAVTYELWAVEAQTSCLGVILRGRCGTGQVERLEVFGDAFHALAIKQSWRAIKALQDGAAESCRVPTVG